MGSALSFCRNKRSVKETVVQQRAQVSPCQQKLFESSQRRHGVEGLAYYGFEYRLVKCQKHYNKSSSIDVDGACCFECDTRLFHSESGTMITAENSKQFRLHGRLFDDVSGCCQDIVQERIQNDFAFKFVTISEGDGDDNEPIRALISGELELGEPSTSSDTEVTAKPILIIIGGKGKSRAGVLSVKQLLVSGIHKGSALFHIQKAKERGFSVIMLDPNARGPTRGKETIDSSLTHFFSTENATTSNFDNSITFLNRPIYILAHSAAGGSLARYLFEGNARQILMERIRSIVFTDSTHNIQWIKQDPKLCSFLQCPKCVYIRNTSENPSDTFSNHKNKKPGEAHEGNVWWNHRFGDIKTVWAGTTEHSLMCWVSRTVIWNFFDKCTSDQH